MPASGRAAKSSSPGRICVWKANRSLPSSAAMKPRRSRLNAQYIQARSCGINR